MKKTALLVTANCIWPRPFVRCKIQVIFLLNFKKIKFYICFFLLLKLPSKPTLSWLRLEQFVTKK
ncbi:hypothetical protein D1Z90_07225 [Motilimonas pumila]|uniref:Uncharacterized protein n=1 Tax=Motilimonas pumila TaxID=2303987 RepID=A0A418YGL3_9GAMM|nr:hypothetical protein D1Z90_07225 [Motilimonas pumila]